ncbi:MAG: hypothetical protein AB8B93_03595 [Pseudomonadales bacterium]
MSLSVLTRRSDLPTLLVVATCMLLSACSPATPQAADVPYQLDFDMQELMAHVLDPAADIIWASAGTIVTVEGETDLAPTDDEGWLHVENGAAAVVESANLLMLPGRAVDDGDWREFSLGLAAMGKKAMAAAEAQDADALFAAGADLYQVCVACHQQYDRDVRDGQPGDES